MEVTYVGIDSWNRPVFKDKNNNYYGSTDKIFDYDATKEDVLKVVTETDLLYFGRSFDCEPWGDRVEGLVIVRG